MSEEMLEHFHSKKFKGEKMELTVERISQTGANAGRGLKAGGTWYTAGKFMKGDFKTLHPGDVINAELNGTFINGYELVSNAKATPANPEAKGQTAVPGAPTTKELQIARSAAVKAVICSPIVANHVKNMSIDEAMSEVLRISELMADYQIKGV